jgi:hypothetical protein
MSSILQKTVWKLAFPVQSVRPINQNSIRKHMLCRIDLLTNAMIVDDAIRFISEHLQQQSKEKIQQVEQEEKSG